VRRENNDIRVLVTEGRVWIERRGTADKAAQTNSPPDPKRGLRKRRSSSIDPHPPRSNNFLSWRTGYLIFRDTAPGRRSCRFQSLQRRKIYIEDPAIAGIRIGGNFRSGDADAFPLASTQRFPINVEHAATALF